MYIDEQIYQVILTRYRLESTVWQKYFQRNGGETRGLRDFARGRRQRRKEIEGERKLYFVFVRRHVSKRRALFRLPSRDVSSSHPTTCHLVVYFRCPGPLSILFTLASTKYEGRFARVLCVKTRYRIGDASTTSATYLLYRFCIVCLPFRCQSVARKDVFDTCRKFPYVSARFSLCWDCVEIHIDTINPFAWYGVKIIKIKLLILYNNLRILSQHESLLLKIFSCHLSKKL